MDIICKIRDIYKLIGEFEGQFEKDFGITLNEGMLLCSLLEKRTLSSTELAKNLGLTCSNTSKVIKSVEEQGFVERQLGKEDKRQMYFALTEKGAECILSVKNSKINIPKELKSHLR